VTSQDEIFMPDIYISGYTSGKGLINSPPVLRSRTCEVNIWLLLDSHSAIRWYGPDLYFGAKSVMCFPQHQLSIAILLCVSLVNAQTTYSCSAGEGAACLQGDYCSESTASCINGYCRCFGSQTLDPCTCLRKL